MKRNFVAPSSCTVTPNIHNVNTEYNCAMWPTEGVMIPCHWCEARVTSMSSAVQLNSLFSPSSLLLCTPTLPVSRAHVKLKWRQCSHSFSTHSLQPYKAIKCAEDCRTSLSLTVFLHLSITGRVQVLPRSPKLAHQGKVFIYICF